MPTVASVKIALKIAILHTLDKATRKLLSEEKLLVNLRVYIKNFTIRVFHQTIFPATFTKVLH